MEEKKPGKRLAVGATKSPGAKRGLIIVGAVAAALAAAFASGTAVTLTTSISHLFFRNKKRRSSYLSIISIFIALYVTIIDFILL